MTMMSILSKYRNSFFYFMERMERCQIHNSEINERNIIDILLKRCYTEAVRGTDALLTDGREVISMEIEELIWLHNAQLLILTVGTGIGAFGIGWLAGKGKIHLPVLSDWLEW